MSGFQAKPFGGSFRIDPAGQGSRGNDWSTGDRTSDRSAADLRASVMRSRHMNDSTTSPSVNAFERSAASRMSLPNSKSMHSNLSLYARGGDTPRPNLYPSNDIIVTNTPEHQANNKSTRHVVGKRDVVNNISALKGYSGNTPGSSFHNSEARNTHKSRENLSGTSAVNGISRRKSFADRSSQENSFRMNNTSFGSRKPMSGKKNMLMMEENLPPSVSMYDFPKAEKSIVVREEASETPKLASVDVSQNAVIIFGYPKALTRAVIVYFAKFGRVLEQLAPIKDVQKNFPEGHQQTPILIGPNWIKLTYEEQKSTRRALDENGTLFSQYYAIGVIPATGEILKKYEKAAKFDVDQLENANSMENHIPMVEGNTSTMSEQASFANGSTQMSERTPSVFKRTKEKTVPRTISMSSLDSSENPKQLKLHHGQIFPQKKKMRFMPSLSNIQAESAADERDGDGDKSWLGWTSKRARELVFGWDDL